MDDDEYERERLENIQRNRELLLSLGLNASNGKNGGVGTSSSSSSSSLARRGRKRKGEETFSTTRRSDRRPAQSRAGQRPTTVTTTSFPEAVRKSARLSGQGAKSYNEDALEQRAARERQSPPPAMRLKRIRNPSPPNVDDETRVFERAGLPTRDARGNVLFENNNRHFMPNVTPSEMIRGGMFGGTALRPFYSRIVKRDLDTHAERQEWPAEWLEGVDVERTLTSTEYRPEVNRFGVKAGQTLEEWESNGWVRAQDPRGWWQWYFRFYLGRRTADDARQIGRWQKACGPAGRFKRSLVAKVHQARSTWDDETISPVVRQTLFHWAYALTEHDYHAYLP